MPGQVRAGTGLDLAQVRGTRRAGVDGPGGLGVVPGADLLLGLVDLPKALGGQVRRRHRRARGHVLRVGGQLRKLFRFLPPPALALRLAGASRVLGGPGLGGLAGETLLAFPLGPGRCLPLGAFVALVALDLGAALGLKTPAHADAVRDPGRREPAQLLDAHVNSLVPVYKAQRLRCRAFSGVFPASVVCGGGLLPVRGAENEDGRELRIRHA